MLGMSGMHTPQQSSRVARHWNNRSGQVSCRGVAYIAALVASMVSRMLTWPQCKPGQATTLCSGAADSATRPLGLLAVSVECSRRRSAKLYISTLCSSATTILSRRSLTALTCMWEQ